MNNLIYRNDISDEKKTFIKTLQEECMLSMTHTNYQGIPGDFSSYKNYNEQVETWAMLLMSYRLKLKKLYEALCSRQMNDGEKHALDYYEIQVERICKRCMFIDYELDSDPRGNILYLKLPSGKTNDFGGIGYCVP